jgi:hypothetical protein
MKKKTEVVPEINNDTILLKSERYTIICHEKKNAGFVPMDLLDIGIQNMDNVLNQITDKQTKIDIINGYISRLNEKIFNINKEDVGKNKKLVIGS